MTAKTADEIRGFEFDWLASDADGHVALFSTAGGGFAPPEFLVDTDAHDAAIDSILARRASMRAISARELKLSVENTWTAVAERGLFAFDSDPNGGPYRRVAVPERAIGVADLPEPAAAVVKRLVLGNVRFSELQELSTETLRQVGCG